jgi:hypothetical protein
MEPTYTIHVKITGPEGTLSEIGSKAFLPENWIPAPSDLQATELDAWKLTHWGCTSVYTYNINPFIFILNEDSSIHVDFMALGGIPVAFFSTLATLFQDATLEYEFYEIQMLHVGYGIGTSQPMTYHLNVDANREEVFYRRDWKLKYLFYV